ncbi:MAG: hypothetical protein ACRDTC_22770 [Pseudonocardiaceae bacterium]
MNVWTHGLLAALMEIPTPDPDSPYPELPHGANMRVSIRRTLRVGTRARMPVEDLGVRPDHRHLMTRADLLADNVDLLARAAQLLAEQPVRRIDVTTTRGIDRGDWQVRPAAAGPHHEDHRRQPVAPDLQLQFTPHSPNMIFEGAP